MTKPKAIIADDEELLAIGLRKMLEKLWPELNIVGEASDGNHAVTLIHEYKPDIAFLDINMPTMTGLEVAAEVSNRTRVVFVTAYDQYAIQAFESEAVDYVLKPVMENRLQITIERLKKHLNRPRQDSALDTNIQKIIQILENKTPPEKLRLIKVKTGSEIRFLPVAQVIYFKAKDKYTIVQTAQNEFLINTPIKDLEKELDPERFRRVHRSAIVNIDKISKIKRSFTKQMIIAFNHIDHTIQVSRSFEHLFK